MIPFRHKHNCRFHKRFRFMNPRFQQNGTIPYGDDMLIANVRTRFDPDKSDVIRRIPTRWARFPDDDSKSKKVVELIKLHHHDHEHEHEHDHDEDQHHHHHEHENDLDNDEDHHHFEHDHDKHHHRHHHRHHHHHHEKENDNEERGEHEHKGVFMESFRNFFDLF